MSRAAICLIFAFSGNGMHFVVRGRYNLTLCSISGLMKTIQLRRFLKANFAKDLKSWTAANPISSLSRNMTGALQMLQCIKLHYKDQEKQVQN